MSIPSEVYPKDVHKAELVPVAYITVKAAPSFDSFKNATKNHAATYIPISDGEITPIDNKLGLEFNLNSITGHDRIVTDLEDGVSTLNCDLYGKTPNGSPVFITYSGVLKQSDKSLAVLGGNARTSDFNDAYVTNNMKFTLDQNVENDYKWVTKYNLIGKGRFIRDSSDNLYVQYAINVVN